ncbi:hypothetical protein RRG08_063941 [Elysia crispata]|uniref:Uncharacterized protein n=1 Tax=Elysia crispata TaxID=231223 RepID=A0AAE0YFL4_9GAST|nr:hypothetical protein RRG08_063941 [Elysia crispata]
MLETLRRITMSPQQTPNIKKDSRVWELGDHNSPLIENPEGFLQISRGLESGFRVVLEDRGMELGYDWKYLPPALARNNSAPPSLIGTR